VNSKKEGKNNMKKLLKSKKALSPVVAAIILIAVTVAVSIAVAVWMGSLSFNFMSTEQLTITGVTFGPANTTITARVLNTGTVDVIISGATVTGNGVNSVSVAVPVNIGEGVAEDVNITITDGAWSPTYLYNIEIVSTKGNVFAYSDTA
jgi:flagellin-like protein